MELSRRSLPIEGVAPPEPRVPATPVKNGATAIVAKRATSAS